MAKRARKLHSPLRQKPLRHRIEKTIEPSQPTDTLDSDILGHVHHFLTTPIPKMEQFSLETQEGAQQALVMLQKTHAMLEERIRTARMLKTLCEQSEDADTTKPTEQ